MTCRQEQQQPSVLVRRGGSQNQANVQPSALFAAAAIQVPPAAFQPQHLKPPTHPLPHVQPLPVLSQLVQQGVGTLHRLPSWYRHIHAASSGGIVCDGR